MRQTIIFWLCLVIFGLLLSIASAAYAEGDVIKPPPGTVPESPEPWRELTYCPIMFGSDVEGWIWPVSR